MRIAIILLATLAFSTLGYSATFYVPDDFPTIQEALSASAVKKGDTILVHPGTYVENIGFSGKAVTLKSLEGPEATVIDGNDSYSVVAICNIEDPGAVLDGFTITNGNRLKGGGGIFCENASP
ncbi:MAG: right-handed parallel beta-helix repeat-containing protein, partial [Planctomycetota bacterium]